MGILRDKNGNAIVDSQGNVIWDGLGINYFPTFDVIGESEFSVIIVSLEGDVYSVLFNVTGESEFSSINIYPASVFQFDFDVIGESDFDSITVIIYTLHSFLFNVTGESRFSSVSYTVLAEIVFNAIGESFFSDMGLTISELGAVIEPIIEELDGDYIIVEL